MDVRVTLLDDWRTAALKIGFTDSLRPWQNLARAQYESLHDDGDAEGLEDPGSGFVMDCVGGSSNLAFSHERIEYYRFVR